jgi:hypothetical protein
MVGRTSSDGGVAVAVRAVAFVTACETEVLVMIVNAMNIIGHNNEATVAEAGRFDFNSSCFLFVLLLPIANLKPTCDFFKGENDALLFVLLISDLGDEPSRLLLKLRPVWLKAVAQATTHVIPTAT